MQGFEKRTVTKWVSVDDEHLQFDSEAEVKNYTQNTLLRKALKLINRHRGKRLSDKSLETVAATSHADIDYLIDRGVLASKGIKPLQKIVDELDLPAQEKAPTK